MEKEFESFYKWCAKYETVLRRIQINLKREVKGKTTGQNQKKRKRVMLFEVKTKEELKTETVYSEGERGWCEVSVI